MAYFNANKAVKDGKRDRNSEVNIQTHGKLTIVVSANVPTDNALKNFHDQLYKMLLDTRR